MGTPGIVVSPITSDHTVIRVGQLFQQDRLGCIDFDLEMSFGTFFTESGDDDEAIDDIGFRETREQHTCLLFAAMSDLWG